MDSPRWNDAQLDAMRQTQDPVADPVVAALFAAGKVDAVAGVRCLIGQYPRCT